MVKRLSICLSVHPSTLHKLILHLSTDFGSAYFNLIDNLT